MENEYKVEETKFGTKQAILVMALCYLTERMVEKHLYLEVVLNIVM